MATETKKQNVPAENKSHIDAAMSAVSNKLSGRRGKPARQPGDYVPTIADKTNIQLLRQLARIAKDGTRAIEAGEMQTADSVQELALRIESVARAVR